MEAFAQICDQIAVIYIKLRQFKIDLCQHVSLRQLKIELRHFMSIYVSSTQQMHEFASIDVYLY